MPTRRRILAGAAAAPFFWVQGAAAQAWPSKTVRIINAYPPGSSSDLLARVWAQMLGEVLGATFIVESKPGAAGSLGATFVARADADGHTLLIASKDIVIVAPILKKNLPYDPDKDFVALNKVVDFPVVMACRSELNVKTVQDLVRLAKSKPGQLRFTSAGIGSTQHLAVEIFMRETGTSMQHIPYQGGGPALFGLVKGEGDVMVASEALLGPPIKEGKLVALAGTSKQRSPTLPNVPTISEAGIRTLNLDGWYGLFVPRGTPESVQQRLNEAIAKVSVLPEYRQKIAAFGGVSTQMSPPQFQQALGEEKRYWADAVKSSNVVLKEY